MRNIAIALTMLLAAACADPEAGDEGVAGTSGEAGSTGGEAETDDADDESSSGGPVEEWPGNVLADVRVVTAEEEACREACGASTCMGRLDPVEGLSSCTEYRDESECMCADFTDEIDGRTTHAFSPCYLNPNSGSTQAVDPPKWDQGSCDDFCGRFGYTCAGTIWGYLKECPNVRDEWPNLYEDGPITRPADINGPDGVFVAVCELP